MLKRLFVSLLITATFLRTTAQEKGTFTNLGPQLFSATLQGSAFVQIKKKNFIYTVVRGRPAHLVGFNLKTNELIADFPLADTDGSWSITATTNGTVYVASSQGYVFQHLAGTKEIKNLGIALQNEKLVWDVVAGKKNEVYGGTYPGGRVFKYQSKEGFVDILEEAVVNQQQYAQFLAFDKKTNKLYVAVYVGANVVEIDLSTKKRRELLPEHYQKKGSIYNIKLLDTKTGTKILVWLNNIGVGRETLVIDVNSGKHEAVLPTMEVRTLLQNEKNGEIFYTVDANLFSATFIGKKLENVEKILNFTGKTKASRWKNENEIELLTSDGSLVSYNLDTKAQKIVQLKIPQQPIDISNLFYGPDNKIWLSGYLVGGNSTYDLKTKGTTPYLGLMQAEGMAKKGNDIYFGIYPSAQLFKYNTNEEWSLKKKNPSVIGQIKGQSRPFTILSTDSLNSIYFGTVPDYGKLGGALVAYNISNKEITVYDQIIKNQAPVTLTYLNGLIWGGTTTSGGLGVSPSEKEGKLFCWDPIANKLIYETTPIPGIMAITALIKGPKQTLWGMTDGIIFEFDPASKATIFQQKIYEVPAVRTHLWRDATLVLHPSGKIYMTGGKKLYCIDPETKSVSYLKDNLDLMTMDGEGNLYFRYEADLWTYTP